MCNVEGPPLKKKRLAMMAEGEPLPIYLDHNATTPIGDEAWSAMLQCRNVWGNPSSTHPYGLQAKFIVERARQVVGQSIGVPEESSKKCITFTSGGTEANNLALIGGYRACLERDPSRTLLVSSSMEHPAVEEVLKNYFERERGVRVLRVRPLGATGVITADTLRAALSELKSGARNVAIVSIMHANNETGIIQPIEELVRVAKEMCGPEVLFHTDAAQTIGKIPVRVDELGVDMLSICAHKFYGPKGVGALYHRDGFVPRCVTYGAGHEAGVRPGTENIVLINGLAAAIEHATRNLEQNAKHMLECRDALAAGLRLALSGSRCRYLVNGSLEHALPNTLNIAICSDSGVYISAQRLMSDVGLKVCMSAGSACHSTNGDEPIVVSSSLTCVGVSEERAVGTLRLTTGKLCSVDDVARAAKIIARKAAEQLQDS